jgi:hypothetical protein
MPVVKIKGCLTCHIAHEWLFEGATLKELRLIKQLTGMNVKQFAEMGDDLDPEAIAALIYILHTRDNIKIPFDDIDLDFNDFEMEPTEEEAREIEELEKKMQEAAEGNDPKVVPITSGRKEKAGSKHK